MIKVLPQCGVSIRIVQFIAIMLTAVALVPSGAHLLEIANKVGLDRGRYMTVQQIYRGWEMLGIVLIGAMLANGLVAVAMRSQMIPAALATIAAILICLGLGIFFIWTFPANQMTGNWTVAPHDWEALRAQWEYSHAANAVVTFLALCSTIGASLTWSR
jgi:hypothetical protein